MQVHHRGVAPRQDQPYRLAFLGADSAEDVGGSGALICRRGRTTATPGPAAGDLVLLTDPGFVTEPQFDVGRIKATLAIAATSAGQFF